MKTLVSIGLTLAFGLVGLSSASAQAPAAAPPAKPGVYADTGKGIQPLSAYYSGVATEMPVGFQAHTSAVPKADKFNAFVVNVEGISPSNVNMYWLNGITEVWAGGQTPLKVQTQPHTGGFSISSPDTVGKTNGFVILEVKPTTGTRKFYAVNMGKEFSLGAK
ncbi:MAG: hypothetical protein IT176_09550 [Acidobacteria bacterium]|nr:hypothetical protein [Acidobacteriota bacterium]